MALIKCTECGKEVSSLADKCPNCAAPIKKGFGCIGWGFIILFGVILFGIMISTLLDKSTKKPIQSSNISLHYNLSEADLGAQEQRLEFVETAIWYGGIVEKGIVMEQNVNIVVAVQKSKRGNHKAIIQFYRTRYQGCQFLQITFYPVFKSAPKSREEWSKSTSSNQDKAFAVYIFEPIKYTDTLSYF